MVSPRNDYFYSQCIKSSYRFQDEGKAARKPINVVESKSLYNGMIQPAPSIVRGYTLLVPPRRAIPARSINMRFQFRRCSDHLRISYVGCGGYYIFVLDYGDVSRTRTATRRDFNFDEHVSGVIRCY